MFIRFRGDTLAEEEFLVFGMEIKREKERFKGTTIVNSIATGLLLDVVQEFTKEVFACLLVAAFQRAPEFYEVITVRKSKD